MGTFSDTTKNNTNTTDYQNLRFVFRDCESENVIVFNIENLMLTCNKQGDDQDEEPEPFTMKEFADSIANFNGMFSRTRKNKDDSENI